jgi:ATP-dependent Clp protease adaptor protein ClpS
VSEKRERKGDVITEVQSERKLARPRLYRVLFHNDDYTPREFVLQLLIQLFHHGEAEAQALTTNIERHGVGVVGVYTFEIAETKVAQVTELAQKNEFPLLATLEPDEGTS